MKKYSKYAVNLYEILDLFKGLCYDIYLEEAKSDG